MSTEQNTQSAAVVCDDVEALLPMVADGILDVESDPAVFAHIGRCVSCQESLAHHDMIQIALEQSREPVSATASQMSLAFSRWHHRRLPWPVAMAASVAAAIGLWTWLNTMQNNRAQDKQTHTQVVPVQTESGHSVYVVIDGDNVTVIDPRAIDGKAAPVREATIPVNLKK